MGFFALKFMFFSSPTPVELIVVAVLSVTCIGLGVLAIIRSGRPLDKGKAGEGP
jgi:hypothetical protein